MIMEIVLLGVFVVPIFAAFVSVTALIVRLVLADPSLKPRPEHPNSRLKCSIDTYRELLRARGMDYEEEIVKMLAEALKKTIDEEMLKLIAVDAEGVTI